MHRSILRSFLLGSAVLGPVTGQDYRPRIDGRSDAAEKALVRFQHPEDLEVTLWAAEPDLANPVAFCFDEQGRMYVAESFRLHKGVTDNRSHRDWLDEELACRTVADRVKMYRRRFADKIDEWQSEHERIRRLEDTDGDGRADRSVVFADGFKDLADGIAAGLLARQGEVSFTCIPSLWSLRDTDGDGRADARKALQTGYGVHTSLLGHDLHGLRIGPDGMLYFSIGDRGFHVETGGRTVSLPDEGAVLRCHLDGSGLEVVHRGLRNPQELAFDAHGNLFTGDNNSDGGDKARWVYVVEGGHSGWHIGFQSIPGRGPWNAEKLWHPHFPGQASYIVPPIANLANGPSGLTCDPGAGLPERYRGRFFLCEFRGGSDNSGVLAIGHAPKGAGFELTDEERLLWKVLPTDVEFGYDGALYVADWTEGWGQPRKGRIYKVTGRDGPLDTGAILSKGLRGLVQDTVLGLLRHVDQRVRQEAQFELVRRQALGDLAAVARRRNHRLERLHAIWGLGQLGRKNPALWADLEPLLDDPDHEIRAQVAKVCGWGRWQAAAPRLIELLTDRSSRVRFFAAISLGQIGDGRAAKPLAAMLRANAGRDAYLRHAGVMGLAGLPDEAALLELAQDADRHVRMAVVVALRRRQSAAVAGSLQDTDPLVVLEAARAIHDEPIPAGLPALAALLVAPGVDDEPLLRRAVNANYRLATPECVQRLVACVAGEFPETARVDALKALAAWQAPSGRDRVVNLWRPLEPRDPAAMLAVLEPVLGRVFATAPDAVRRAAVELVATYDRKRHGAALSRICADAGGPARLRRRVLEVLDAWNHPDTVQHATTAANGAEVELRKAGVRILAQRDPEAAIPALRKLIRDASRTERQNAMATLGTLKTPAADAVLTTYLERLAKGELAPALALELLTAAKKRTDPALVAALESLQAERNRTAAKDILAIYGECLEGGDRKRGEERFFKDDGAISCQRCHKIGDRGGEAGPDLSDVGTRLSREAILASLLDPGREISAGFGTIVFTLADDSVVAGVVKRETKTALELLDADGKVITVEKAKIVDRSEAVSSMPPMAGILQRPELRDLVEYLAAQKKPAKKAPK